MTWTCLGRRWKERGRGMEDKGARGTQVQFTINLETTRTSVVNVGYETELYYVTPVAMIGQVCNLLVFEYSINLFPKQKF